MNDAEQNDLLIRLEANISQMCASQKSLTKEVNSMKHELSKRQCLLHTNQIQKLERSFDPMQCSRNTEKIMTIEKLTWAAVLTSISVAIGLMIKSVWSAMTT